MRERVGKDRKRRQKARVNRYQRETVRRKPGERSKRFRGLVGEVRCGHRSQRQETGGPKYFSSLLLCFFLSSTNFYGGRDSDIKCLLLLFHRIVCSCMAGVCLLIAIPVPLACPEKGFYGRLFCTEEGVGITSKGLCVVLYATFLSEKRAAANCCNTY